MSPLPLKISMDNGAIVKTVKFESSTKVLEAHRIIEDKVLDGASGENYGLFLTSSDDQATGIWLEPDKMLEYYMLREGDTLLYLNRIRTLRVRMLDGTVKTLEVDESIPVSSLMLLICSKIGIANHDEYGLCRDEKEETDETKANTGTLTLKRKPQEKEKDRDTKMEHLRKKLKTDDEVQWLDSTKSLRELSVEPGETVLLKRRLFYSDRNVDSRDPVQLNLLYVQARDAILSGTHPITENMACEFAGMQCQIQFGDYNESKHTSDFIDPKEFLPENYSKSRGIKKKIVQEHMKHTGTSELDAKTLYVRTARSLHTYGVTFFLVKEKQKGKNRLVPRLLGINAESIQRLDENTKETLVIWPLTHVQRWKANDTTFTLDFGEYSDKQYACQTTEARRIENVLKSYIDIILKKKKAKDYFGKYGFESEPMAIDTVGASKASIIQHTYHGAQNLKEESFIGPSRILSVEGGNKFTTGHQIMTVQRMIVTERNSSSQSAAAGVYQATVDVNVLKELKWKQRLLPKLLTGVDTRAVTIVELMTESGQIDEGELKNLIKILNEDLPDIDAGVKKLCEGDKLNDQEKADLLKQLEDLRERIETLTTLAEENPAKNAQEIADVASKVSEISTRMFNSVDPASKRRSKLLMSSKMSFIEEDLAESEREKRSLLLTLGKARENLIRLLNSINENSGAAPVSEEDLARRRNRMTKNLARLNAAIASLLASHSDPNEIDYAGAKTATDTIMEAMPEIEKDAKIISNSDNQLNATAVTEDLRRLLDSVQNLLEHVGSQDPEKLNDAAISLANTSKSFNELCYPYVDSSKNNEVIALTKVVDDKTSELLLKTNELAIASEQGISSDLDAAGGRCVDACRRLMACAQLAAPFIHDARCKSAMLSSANAVASSVKDLATCYKPLASNSNKDQIDELLQASLEVAKALDMLNEACNGVPTMDLDEYVNTETDYTRNNNENGQMDDMNQVPMASKAERQALHETINIAQDKARKAISELYEEPERPLSKKDLHETQEYISECLGRINAAAGSLLALHADHTKLDLPSIQTKLVVIGELLPEIVKGMRTLVLNDDPEERNRKLEDTRQFCETALELCDYTKENDIQKMNECALRFGEDTVKVQQSVSNSGTDANETKVIVISTKLNNSLDEVLKLLNDIKSDGLNEEDVKRINSAQKECVIAKEKLQKSVHELDERNSTLSAIHDIECTLNNLDATIAPLGNDPRANILRERVKALRDLLEKLRETTSVPGHPLAGPSAEAAAAVRAAREHLEHGPTRPPIEAATQNALEKAAAEKLARTGTAAACLLIALSHPNHVDVASGSKALHMLAELVPAIAEDVKYSSYVPDERKRRIQLVGALCTAAEDLCHAARKNDLEKLNASCLAFGDAASGLLYCLDREAKPETANQIIHKSKALVGNASDLLFCASDLANATIDATVANGIDEAGSHCADAAGQLLTCAKLTSAFLHDPDAHNSMLSAIQELQRTLDKLEASCEPLGNDPRANNLRGKVKALRDLLDKLREAASLSRLPLTGPGAAASAAIRAARKNIEKGPTRSPDAAPSQHALKKAAVEKLARAGAAAACLLAAHSDPKHVDIASGSKALHTLAELVPAIVEDVKYSSAGCNPEERKRRTELIGALCDAADALCHAAGNGELEKLNTSSLAFGDASSGLLYCLDREVKPETANQIIHKSKALVGDASDLLFCASDLAKATTDPAIANGIDEAGSHCADAAGQLLTCAKLTSAFLQDPEAHNSMLSAIQELQRTLDKLEASCEPLGNDPRANNLRGKVKALRDLLDKLREATSLSRLPLTGPGAAASAAIRAARKNIEKGSTRSPVSAPTQHALEKAAVEKLAHAGAAAACLLAAHSDPKHVEIASGSKALHTLAELVPAIVEDVKHSSAGCNPEERKRRTELIGALCDAADALCHAAGNGELEKLNTSSLAFGDASSGLLYCLDREVKPEMANQIIHKSKALVGDASDLLFCASDLAKATTDPAIANGIDEAGSHCADAAGQLLTCAKLTSAFLHDPDAHNSMLSAIQELQRTLDKLEASCEPLGNDPRANNLRGKVNALRDLLDKLREATSLSRLPLTGPGAAASAAIRAARKNIEKGPTRSPDAAPTQHALEKAAVEKLAHAGAAAACLLAAHSDPKQVDIASGSKALQTLAELVPAIVEDVKYSSAGYNPEERKRRTQLTGALCDAADALCHAAGNGELEKLNASSLEFGDASSGLLYCLDREAKPETANQIIHKSKNLAGDASDLLFCASDLAKATTDPAIANGIDDAGSHCADAAGQLLTCAKLTSAFLHDPDAHKSMLSAIQELQRTLDKLEASCEPLGNDPRATNLREKVKALRDLLDKLREASSLSRLPMTGPGAAASAAIRAARKNIEKGPTRSPVAAPTQHALEKAAVEKLAHAGAAAACLLAAHSDPKHVDIASGSKALHTLAELVPAIVEDVKYSSAGCNPEERKRRTQLIGALCDAADALCNAAGNGELEKLNTSSLAFGDASSGLLYCLDREAKPETANQIIHKSKALVGDASDLLFCASDLAKATTNPAIANGIDEAGSHCADAAGQLLTCAKLTSAFLHDPEAHNSMLSAIQELQRTLNKLEASCEPLGNDPRANNLRGKVKALRDLLDKLREAASLSRLPLTGPGAAASAAIRAARNNIEKGSPRSPVAAPVQHALEKAAVEKLANAGAAAACLLAAHSDPKHVDIASGSKALQTLAELVPAIVEDVKYSSAGSIPDERKRRTQLTGALCDAADALCHAAGNGELEKLTVSSMAFSDASSNLLFCLDREAKPETANKIIYKSKTLADDVSELLLCANGLTNATTDPVVANAINDTGSHCAESAGRLLTCAKLTSAFLRNPETRDSILSAIQDLERDLDKFEASYKPLGNDPRTNNLRGKVKALRDLLDKLREAASGNPLAGPGAEAGAAIRAARKHLESRLTQSPVTTPTQHAHEKAAAEKLAHAGVAVANLLTAHSDPKHVDVASGTKALQMLAELVPAVAEDVKHFSSGCVPEERKKVIQLAGELCDAGDALCHAACDGDIETLNASSLAFGDSSSGLFYCLDQENKPETTNRIIFASKSLAGDASDLLLGVSDLTKTTDPELASVLDKVGSHCADAVGQLLTFTKLLSPTLNYPENQTAMLDSVNKLSTSLNQLITHINKVSENKPNDSKKPELLAKTKKLLDSLDKFRERVKEQTTSKESILPKTAIESMKIIDAARQILNQEIVGNTSEKTGNTQILSEHVIAENASIMALLNCFADATNLNEENVVALYEEITKRINLISNEALNVAKCTSSPNERNQILDSARKMCDAAKELCQHSSNKNMQKLHESAIDYSEASSRMLHAIGSNIDAALSREFFARAKTLTERMSELLADVSDLSALNKSCAMDIDDAGSRCADATRGMLSCAHLAAPSITDRIIREAMICSTDIVAESLSALEGSIQPLTSSQVKAQVNNLTEELNSLKDFNHHLVRYVPELTKEQKIAKTDVGKDLDNIIQHLENVQKNMQEIQNPKSTEILKQTIGDFNKHYTILEDETKLMNELRNCLKPMEIKQNAINDSLKQLYTNCDPSAKKELEEKFACILTGIPKVLETVSNTLNNTCPLKKINIIVTELKNYENQIDSANQILSTKLKKSSEFYDLKRSNHNMADVCYELRNLLKLVKRNKNVNSLENISSDLLDLEEDLDHIFSEEERSPVISKVSQYALHEIESDLMFHLVALNKNQGNETLVTVLRRYVHGLKAFCEVTNPENKNSLIIYVKRIILLILLLTWYIIRCFITDIPIDEDEKISFVKSILNEINNATQTASQVQIILDPKTKAAYDILLFPPREVAVFNGTTGELVEKMSREANRFAASLPVAAMSAGEDAKNMEAANMAVKRMAELFAQMPRNDNSDTHLALEESVQKVRFAAFKLLRAGAIVMQDPKTSMSKRLLLDGSRVLDENINGMIRIGNPKEQLLQQCEEIVRGLQIHQLLTTSPMLPMSKDSLSECLEFAREQRDVLEKVISDKSVLNREKFAQTLISVNDSVHKSMETAAQAAYLISISEQHRAFVQEGLPNINKLTKLIIDGKEACLLHVENEKRSKVQLKTTKIKELMNDISTSAIEACKKIEGGALLSRVEEILREITTGEPSVPKLLQSLNALSILINDPKIMPVSYELTPQAKEKQDSLAKAIKDLYSKFLALLLKEIKSPKASKLEVLKWKDYDSYKKDLLDTTDSIIKIIGDNITKNSEADEDNEMDFKNYLQKQVNLATKWLQAPCYDVKSKNKGIVSIRNMIEQAKKISDGLKNGEKEELELLCNETNALLDTCSQKYDNDKSRELIDKLHELKKTIEETVINRVVEDFINDEEIFAEFKMLVEHASVDDKSYKFKLEKSIASLVEHLGKVTTTARIVAVGGTRDKRVTQQLLIHSSQAELLAPKLVQAAKAKLDASGHPIVMEDFVKDSNEYSQTIDKIRDLCDRSVDPLDFVRTAGEVIQKMCEEVKQHEPMKATVITRLVNRVIQVGASESAKTKNEELAEALKEAKSRLKAVATSPDTRKSQIPDWKTTTVEILRTTNAVESAINGETIFKREVDSDQPIFMAAHSLHAAVREWSARDNELVAVAKRMAVQMAHLSGYMITDQKQALINTTKSIVGLSADATRLARKLALECTDVSLRNNLLQVSERIPTIGGQLKMLSTVKAMRFGHQGSEENREAMTMLIENAQNLMQTIEEVVKAATGASVKIQSQRGAGRMRWVRKPTYYT